MLSKGQKISGRYVIVKTIGEGGMANVYLAVDEILNRQVAIKVLRGDLAGDEKFIRRFEREAKSVSELSHPNIVEVYDVGVEDNQHYIVMEYIEGRTLKQLVQKRGTLTVAEVVDIMSQLTDGLSHAHDAYIIHRDIKPQNILILDNGIVKITDFGIAMAMNATQLTQTNSVMGSVHYLPPEQASGKSATVKSDIYSSGILMYELLTGSVPFKGDNAVEIALKQLKEKIPSVRKQNPLIPQSVENIIIKATAKNPKNRYDSVRDMHNDLINCLSNPNESMYVYSYPESDSGDSVKNNNVSSSGKVVPIDNDDIGNISGSNSSKRKKSGKLNIGIVFGIVISIVLIFVIIGVILYKVTDNKDIKVPNVVGMSMDDAILKIEKAGFKYTIKESSSDDVNEDGVIKTSPRGGSSRKKGSNVIITVSTGSSSYLLEDFIGKNYRDVKAQLSIYDVKVIIEKRTVENPSDYVDTEDIIIDQSPKFDENNDVRLKKGDSITLFIPDVVAVYPDMKEEEWKLEDVEAFAELYGLKLDVSYEETNDYEKGRVIYQNRSAGSSIVSGITLKVKIASAKATTYSVFVYGIDDSTGVAISDTKLVKDGLKKDDTGSYKCTQKEGYKLVTVGGLSYTIKDSDLTIVCHYTKVNDNVKDKESND